MIEVKHLLRKAYLDKLNNVVYQGKVIPGDDENLTKPPVALPSAVGPGIEAYFLIQNQTLQDASAKCGINQNTQLQIDVTTVFTAGRGGNFGNYAHADQISSVILQTLFINGSNIVDLTLSGANLWRGWLEGSTHIFESYETARVYRNILILNHSISQ